jgi:hypothetical protein
MGCGHFLAGTLFTVLTLSTTGVTTLAVVALFVVVQVKRIYPVSKTFEICLIAALVVSVVVLILAIVGSCCGGKCLRCLLAIVYLPFGAAIGAFAAIVALQRDKIVPALGCLWTSDSQADLDTEKAIHIAFACSCYQSNDTCTAADLDPKYDETCGAKIQEVIDNNWQAMF